MKRSHLLIQSTDQFEVHCYILLVLSLILISVMPETIQMITQYVMDR